MAINSINANGQSGKSKHSSVVLTRIALDVMNSENNLPTWLSIVCSHSERMVWLFFRTETSGFKNSGLRMDSLHTLLFVAGLHSCSAAGEY